MRWPLLFSCLASLSACGSPASEKEQSASDEPANQAASPETATSTGAENGTSSESDTSTETVTDTATDTVTETETDTSTDTGTDTEDEADFSDYQALISSYLDGDAAGTGGYARDIAFDDAGNFVIVGGVQTTNFVTTPSAYDTDYGAPGTPQLGDFGSMDVFVSKFDASGTLLWSTYLGGPSYDRAYAVEIANNGDVVVAGRAGSDFPTTTGALQEIFAGDSSPNSAYGPQDGFVSRLSADGTSLVWSTYFGANGSGFVRDIDIDSSGRILVALSDVEGNFDFSPQTTGPRSSIAGSTDAYYGKLSSDGSDLLFGTYLGGTDGGAVDGINPSIRAHGDAVYFLTFTEATDVDCITAGAYQSANAGQADLLLVRFDEDNTISYCTYYGGSGFEGMETHCLAVDDSGNAFISGGTGSADLPITAGAAQTSLLHSGDGFVAKFSPTGELIAGTFVGMSSAVGDIIGMNIEGLAITPNGDVVGGGSDRPNNTSIRHAVISRLRGDLTEILYVDTYGGTGRDELRSVDVNANGDVAYAGHTTSSDWPAVSAPDPTYHSSSNPAPAFVILQPQY